MHRKNLVGQTFERLTVLKDNGRNSRRYILWLCKCSCGKDIDAIGYELENGHVKSCGCLKAERLGNNSRTHGKSKTSEYSIWCGMIKRIENPNDKFYSEYGGRGIKICDRWRHSFEFFNQDMGSRPTKNHSIERIEVNGDYEPGNCKWATLDEQARNKRNNINIKQGDRVMILEDWARELKITRSKFKTVLKHETKYTILSQ